MYTSFGLDFQILYQSHSQTLDKVTKIDNLDGKSNIVGSLESVW